MSYEDLLSKNSFTQLADMYLEAGNSQMADKVLLYESALGGKLFAYLLNQPGYSVNVHFIRDDELNSNKLELLGVLVAADVDVGELDKAVDSALSMLCTKLGVSESMLKMKLELRGE